MKININLSMTQDLGVSARSNNIEEVQEGDTIKVIVTHKFDGSLSLKYNIVHATPDNNSKESISPG